MKNTLFFLVIALAAITFTSCDKVVGEGPVVTTDRNVTAFTGMDVSVPADVYYSLGTACTVQIQGQQNIIDLIETKVEADTLKIKFDRNNVNIKSKGIRINITSPDISKIQMSGSANLHVTNGITPADFLLSLSGSCNATVDSIATGSLHTSISGSGNIVVNNGSAENLLIEISGSGDVNMLGVSAKEVTTHSSGSGTIKVTATDKLDAHISGSGHVYYKGSPDVTSDISGSGGVSKIQ